MMVSDAKKATTADEPSQAFANVSLAQDDFARVQSAKEMDLHTREWRRSTLVVLIHHFCLEHGLTETAAALKEESRIKINDFTVCDNVDLETILTDYEAFFHHRFRKKVKLIKFQPSINPNFLTNYSSSSSISQNIAHGTTNHSNGVPRGSSSAGGRSKILARVRSKSARPRISPAPSTGSISQINQYQDQLKPAQVSPEVDLGKNLKVTSLATSSDSHGTFKQLQKPLELDSHGFPSSSIHTHHHGPNLSNYLSEEWRELSRQISRDIVTNDLGVTMEDVVGMAEAKKVVMEAIVYPRQYPEFYDHLEPWKGLLLHGPPGTGKTMLAKAIASECKLPFFNVAVSSMVSKWRGESEKAIKVLFDMARKMAPSIIFIDEIDSIGGRRSSGCEHEASRRMKTELLVQLDGLLNNYMQRTESASYPSPDDDMDVVGCSDADRQVTLAGKSHRQAHVFVVAASNMPWDIDPALLRRLEKHIHVGLPNTQERFLILQKLLNKRVTPSQALTKSAECIDYSRLAQATEGFSGAEIHIACKEACMESMRHVIAHLERMQGSRQSQQGRQRPKMSSNHIRQVTTEDVLAAVDKILVSRRKLSQGQQPPSSNQLKPRMMAPGELDVTE